MPHATRTIMAGADGYTTSTGDRFDVLREALDAELATVATFEKPLYFRDPESGEPNGEMRWLPACDVEGAPVRGIRIDAAAIEEMAASINANPRALPINGGPTPAGLLPSAPHGDSDDSSTLANGRAQWGVVVQTAGTTKLYLHAEVMPHIAREIDVGRLAEGSVCFNWQSVEATESGDVPRGVELISHAFTNDPAVKTLEPANSVREARRSYSLAGAMRSALRPKGKTMSTKTNTAVRMSFADAEATIAALLPDVDKAELGTEVIKLVAAKAESKADKPADPPAEKTAEELAARAAPAAALADAPPPDDAAMKEAEAAALLDAVRKMLGRPDATIAEAIAMLEEKASAAPAEPPPAGMSAERAGHVALDMLRGEVAKLTNEVVALRPLKAAADARAHADFVDGEAKKRSMSLTATQRSGLLALDRKSVLAAFGLIHSPMQSDVMGANRSTETPAAPMTLTAAIDAEMVDAAKAGKPGEQRQITRARAQRAAEAKHPHLFGKAALGDADPIV